MTKKGNTTLALLEIFERYTNKEHPLTINEILDKLSELGITIERKTFYREFDKFISSGYDIRKEKTDRTRYYYNRYSFDVVEALIIMDILGSCKVLTDEQYETIIDKVRYTQLDIDQDDLEVVPRYKLNLNNNDYYDNLLTIVNAIKKRMKITFKMTCKNVDGSNQYRKNGKEYMIEPYYLAYKNDTYYVIGLDERFDSLSNYRLDHMSDIEISIFKSLNYDEFKDYDFKYYLQNTNDMFQGKEEEIYIEVKKEYVDIVFEKFHQVTLIREDEDIVVYKIKEYVSDKLIKDLISCYKCLKVIEPTEIVNVIKDIINEAYDIYFK